MVYVSVTGMELISEAHAPKFWEYASTSMKQAKEAPGNIFADGAKINNTYHTLTIWESKRSMLRYMQTGHHAEAVKIFDDVARAGKVYGYETPSIKVPTWDELRRIYDAHARPVGKAAREAKLPERTNWRLDVTPKQQRESL